MGITHFPHGIFATPNIGTDSAGYGRLMQLWESDNIFFVDGDNGNTGNDGKEPDNSVTLISTAVGLAAKGATIYVKPRSTVASAQVYYQDTIVIPITKPLLSIIGAGGNTGAQCGVQVKPLTVTTHLIDVFAAGLTLENMRLTLTGGTADLKMSIVHALNYGTPSYPGGLVIRNCRFENDKSLPSITSSSDICSSISLGTCNYAVIENNTFYNCHGSIVGQLSTAAYHNITIRNNIISGVASGRALDMWFSHAGWGLVIANNIFADDIPIHAGGTGGNYFIKVTDAGTGFICGNFFATATLSFGAAGTAGLWPTTMRSAGNTYSAASAGTTTSGMFGTS